MTRRAPYLLLILVLAVVLGGCGTKSSGSGLDSALSYVPKGAPLVVAVDTNPDGGQWQQVSALLGKFPFGGQVRQAIKDRLKSGSTVSYDNDIKPLLGNDLVLAVTAVAQQPGASSPYVIAWKVKDQSVAKRLLARDGGKVSTLGGADVYRSRTGTTFSALKDGTLVAADSQPDLQAALTRAAGADHMTAADFDAALGPLDPKALVRVAGDVQTLLAQPKAAAARKVKWIGALRTFGLTLAAKPDGLEWAFDAKTAGGLAAKDLPLAAGAAPAPVVRRAGEIGIGLRSAAQIVTFGQAVAQLTDPAGYGKYLRDKAKLGRQLGIDVDRDLIGQLTGNAAFSIALDGGFALRADLRDPSAAAATLKKAAPNLRKVPGGKSIRLTTPSGGQGLYSVAKPRGKKVVFGVVGKSFVVASDAARAAQFAAESASTVSGAKGSLVLASDARALVNAIAQRQGQGAAAQLVTGALGDLIGWVDTETGGITGDLKLQIK
jgi:hypothetical protein